MGNNDRPRFLFLLQHRQDPRFPWSLLLALAFHREENGDQNRTLQLSVEGLAQEGSGEGVDGFELVFDRFADGFNSGKTIV